MGRLQFCASKHDHRSSATTKHKDPRQWVRPIKFCDDCQCTPLAGEIRDSSAISRISLGRLTRICFRALSCSSVIRPHTRPRKKHPEPETEVERALRNVFAQLQM